MIYYIRNGVWRHHSQVQFVLISILLEEPLRKKTISLENETTTIAFLLQTPHPEGNDKIITYVQLRIR